MALHTPHGTDLSGPDLPHPAGRAPLPAWRRLLMAAPDHFDVAYAINPHMLDEHGELRRVDRDVARAQWEALRTTFESLGLAVDVLPALPGHPDLVFCANQVLPLPADVAGRPALVPAHMAHPERRGEVAHVVAHLAATGREAVPLAEAPTAFEGTGDGLWHPGRKLLWGGVGPRTEAGVWAELAERYDLDVVTLELVDPDFYHLDTCLCLLDDERCLWLPEAFEERSQALVRALLPGAIEADPDEARALLACNAFAPDGRNVVIQRGAERTNTRLRAAGFEVHEVDTGEFLKAGGSVFCMKLALES